MTRREGRDAEEARSRIEEMREAAGDGVTGRSVKTFQFGDIGNA